jgi:hypothetical protein
MRLLYRKCSKGSQNQKLDNTIHISLYTPPSPTRYCWTNRTVPAEWSNWSSLGSSCRRGHTNSSPHPPTSRMKNSGLVKYNMRAAVTSSSIQEPHACTHFIQDASGRDFIQYTTRAPRLYTFHTGCEWPWLHPVYHKSPTLVHISYRMRAAVTSFGIPQEPHACIHLIQDASGRDFIQYTTRAPRLYTFHTGCEQPWLHSVYHKSPTLVHI